MHALRLARSQIGKWQYCLAKTNCEHFVKWATGLNVSSTQVVAGTTGAVLGAGLVGTYVENPKFARFLGAIVTLGGLAILATKAAERH